MAVLGRPAQQRRVRLVDGGNERLATPRTGAGVDEHDPVAGTDDEAADVEVPPAVVEVLGVHRELGIVLGGEPGWLRHRHAAVEHGPDLDVADANERGCGTRPSRREPEQPPRVPAEDRVLVRVRELARRAHEVDGRGVVVGLGGAVAVRAEQEAVAARLGHEPSEEARVRGHGGRVEPEVRVMGGEPRHPAGLVVARERVEGDERRRPGAPRPGSRVATATRRSTPRRRGRTRPCPRAASRSSTACIRASSM